VRTQAISTFELFLKCIAIFSTLVPEPEANKAILFMMNLLFKWYAQRYIKAIGCKIISLEKEKELHLSPTL
jgi:hypothetical protein